jgi:pimeloyl-ACP methyl ester carboxylesterase
MAETPENRYVRSDNVHIAYQVPGDGPFDLLFLPGFVSNVEALWRSPDQNAFIRRLASFCRLILFDKRSTGMSDRGTHDFTLEQRMHEGKMMPVGPVWTPYKDERLRALALSGANVATIAR